MLVLFESPAGYGLFKCIDESKFEEASDLSKDFQSLEKAQKIVKLKSFSKFADTTEALAAATATVESKLDKGLKKFIKKNFKDLNEKLVVADKNLGGLIKEKLGISCVFGTAAQELIRGIRSQVTSLVDGLSEDQYRAMTLGLAHSLSRYKLKFSPDKVDTMIVQAIGLLDDLDKELNIYSMRVREWYGWHFPEMGKIVSDHVTYAKAIKKMGMRTECFTIDLSDIMDEDIQSLMKEAAMISMGTEISEDDLIGIKSLCDQVIDLSEYRGQLYEYLQNRMNAIAPNLSAMVGELVGARLIAHAGSLMSLAKQPASTVQILGAEKALFRALKSKSATPKYGLIYHASLVGQSAPKNKGKISRVLAAKTALSIRIDALGDKTDSSWGIENRIKVEDRIRQLEGKVVRSATSGGTGRVKTEKYDAARIQAESGISSGAGQSYNDANDSTLTPKKAKKDKKEKKRKAEAEPEDSDEEMETPSKKDKKKKKKEKKADAETPKSEKKSKKRKASEVEDTPDTPSTDKKKKKKAKKE